MHDLITFVNNREPAFTQEVRKFLNSHRLYESPLPEQELRYIEAEFVSAYVGSLGTSCLWYFAVEEQHYFFETFQPYDKSSPSCMSFDTELDYLWHTYGSDLAKSYVGRVTK